MYSDRNLKTTNMRTIKEVEDESPNNVTYAEDEINHSKAAFSGGPDYDKAKLQISSYNEMI